MIDEEKTLKSLKKFNLGKPFSCHNECSVKDKIGGKCCRHLVIRALVPSVQVIDNEFYEVHGIDVIEREPKDDLIELMIGDTSKTPRFLQKQFSKMMRGVLKEVIFKINQPCEELDLKKSLCKIYFDRPSTCRKFSGNAKDNPFRIKECPYEQE